MFEMPEVVAVAVVMSVLLSSHPTNCVRIQVIWQVSWLAGPRTPPTFPGNPSGNLGRALSAYSRGGGFGLTNLNRVGDTEFPQGRIVNFDTKHDKFWHTGWLNSTLQARWRPELCTLFMAYTRNTLRNSSSKLLVHLFAVFRFSTPGRFFLIDTAENSVA